MTVRRYFGTRRPCPQQQNALNVLGSLIGDDDIGVKEVDVNGYVTWLEIMGTTSYSLPADFGSMFPELNKLRLATCRNLTDVSSIAGMRKLRELGLYRCPVLRAFPEELGERLKKLELEHCNAFDCDSSNIRNLEGLEEFVFADHDVEQVPLAVWSLSNLKKLHLHGWRFTAIPKDIGNLTRLEYLRIFGKKITSLSRGIGSLVHVKNIRFYSEDITELPDEMGDLTALETVDLSHCHNLKRIPGLLLQLPHLENLGLYRCYDLFIPTTDILECTNSLIEVECEGVGEATYYDDMKRWRELLRHISLLNKDGRYLLKEEDVSLALWGSAMYHWSKNVDSLLYFLKQKPDVIPASSRKRKVAT